MARRPWLTISHVSRLNIPHIVGDFKFCISCLGSRIFSMLRNPSTLETIEIVELDTVDFESEILVELFLKELSCGKAVVNFGKLVDTPTKLDLLAHDDKSIICSLEVTLVLPKEYQRNKEVNYRYLFHFFRWMESWGYLLYLAIIFSFASSKLGLFPNDSRLDGLKVGKLQLDDTILVQGNGISACIGYSHRLCDPIYLHLHDTGVLALYKGVSSIDPTALIWQSDRPTNSILHRIQFLHKSKYSFALVNGTRLTIWKGKEEVWAAEIDEHKEVARVVRFTG